jgi:predicted nucleic acid-binding protein
MQFLDTNILLYALSTDRREAAKAAKALELLDQTDCVFSVQVLQEFYVQATGENKPDRITHDQAIALIISWQRFRVHDIRLEIMHAAFRAKKRFRISYWDAAIVELARTAGCNVICSEDLNDGQDFGGIRVENPFLRPVRGDWTSFGASTSFLLLLLIGIEVLSPLANNLSFLGLRLFLNLSPAAAMVKHGNRWHGQRDPGAKGFDRVVDSTSRDGIRRHCPDGGQKRRSAAGCGKRQADWDHFRTRLHPQSHPQGKILEGDSRRGDNDSATRNRRAERQDDRLHESHDRKAGAASTGNGRS